jgi:tryptophan synthase alpha chain
MKLGERTQVLKKSGEKALVAFLTAGYPNEDTFRELVAAADAAGCDLIEIGIPFSDPIADGPLIQRSSRIALEGGISLARILDVTGELSKEITTPLLFMSYYNPIRALGIERFAKLGVAAGAVGSIIPDLPLEESNHTRSVLRASGMEYIDLIAPTSSDERIAAITSVADGFLYLVSVTGVTGVRTPDSRDIEVFAGRVRSHTELPLYVGFGIGNAKTAKDTVGHSDGVIIGSALIRLIESGATTSDTVRGVKNFLQEVKGAIVARAGLV